MKRHLLVASVLGLILSLGVGASEPSSTPTPGFAYRHADLALATDDPVPVDCPFCGGDPLLHARRVNAIAFVAAKIAYRVFDESLF